MLTDRFNEALTFAHDLHRSQNRKGTDIPYVSHLLSVSALVLEHGGNEDQVIAGLLHDSAEDQGGARTLDRIRQRFGHDVAEIVSDCTNSWTGDKPAWRERKESFLASLPGKPRSSLMVCLADKTHNAESILWDYRDIGEKAFDRFAGKAVGTRWYYRSLADVFEKAMPGRLSNRLSLAVKGFGG